MTMFGSMQSQLEFLTLTGVIFNALMQGYVCVNTIYQFLIENIYQSPQDFSKSAFAQSIIADQNPKKFDNTSHDYEDFGSNCWPSLYPRGGKDDDDPQAKRKRDKVLAFFSCF